MITFKCNELLISKILTVFKSVTLNGSVHWHK